jgi:peptidoglycan/LPS O-acetylase OafA/YrhL
MGFIRLLFAFTVLIYHAKVFFGYNIADSSIAVLSFYLLSGFYMALILDKKYTSEKRHYLFLFFSNRFLRIFPLYWMMLLLMVLFMLAKFFLHVGTEDNAITHYITFSAHTNPFAFSLNLVNFILRNLTLLITADYFSVNDNTPGYLLVQQAVTLQIELLFYLAAPFLMRLSKKVFLIFSCLYAVIFFAFTVPSNLFPHTLLYAFFANLIFFLLGIATYRFFYQFIEKKSVPPRLAFVIFFVYVMYLLLYNFVPLKFPQTFLQNTDILYYGIFMLSIPFIFQFTNNNALDNFLGKLSYPVYISHFLILKALTNIPLFKTDSNVKTIIAIILTSLFSYIALKTVELPIDTIRQQRVKNANERMKKRKIVL